MNWGPYNAWDIRTRNPKYHGPNKQPPYTSWSQSIGGVSGLIGQGANYLGSNPNLTTAQLFKKYEGTKKYKKGLGNLNAALGQMQGNTSALTDPCNQNNLRDPNQ